MIQETPAAEEATQTMSDAPPEIEAGSESGKKPVEASSKEPSNRASKGSKRKAAKEKPPKPPAPELLEGAVESLLLATGDVIRLSRLRDVLGLPSVAPVKEALEAIESRWQKANVAVQLEFVGGGVRAVTRPEFAEFVARLSKRPARSDSLTKTQLETLSIVAYKQPVPRAEVERIRGVQCGESLRALLERQLIKVVGRSDQPGRPMLYGTTRRFLTSFGLFDLKDLPSAADLKRL